MWCPSFNSIVCFHKPVHMWFLSIIWLYSTLLPGVKVIPSSDVISLNNARSWYSPRLNETYVWNSEMLFVFEKCNWQEHSLLRPLLVVHPALVCSTGYSHSTMQRGKPIARKLFEMVMLQENLYTPIVTWKSRRRKSTNVEKTFLIFCCCKSPSVLWKQNFSHPQILRNSKHLTLPDKSPMFIL